MTWALRRVRVIWAEWAHELELPQGPEQRSRWSEQVPRHHHLRQITRYPLSVLELPGSEPELPEFEVPILNSDSDFDYPKLV